ncbi:MAG TPA: hypothetical protein VF659_11765 [Pyrinomonadaceae bacterium]|jgi:hypothetical protein
MSARPTAEDFRPHVGTRFGVRVQTPRPVELELTEVREYRPQANEPDGMERFSLFFRGPGDIMLKQGTFTLEHPALGEHLLFMVPIAQEPEGFRYEVVFNYFRSEKEP